MKPSSEIPKDAPSFGTSNRDTLSLSGLPSVHINPETPRASEQPASIPKSKGKGKAKKWTDPPLFDSSQVEATEDSTKTLFSFHDNAGAPSGARSPVSPVSPLSHVGTETHEHKITEDTPVSPIQDVTNQTKAIKPIEAKHEPSITAASHKKRTFGDAQLDVPGSKPVNENQFTPFRSIQANRINANTGIFSSADAMKDMMKSVAPKSNYVTTTPKVAAAATTEEKTVPRVAFKPVEHSDFHLVPPPAPSGSISKTGDSGKIAKRSAIKKSAEQPAFVPAKTVDIATPLQSLTPGLAQQAPREPPMALSSGSTANMQSSRVSNPAAGVASPAMSAAAPSFKPLGSFESTASGMMAQPSSGATSFTSSLMAQMTPEARARFMENMSSV